MHTLREPWSKVLTWTRHTTGADTLPNTLEQNVHLIQAVKIHSRRPVAIGLEVQDCCSSIVLQQSSEIGGWQANCCGYQRLVDCIVRHKQSVSVASFVAQNVLPS